MTASELKKIKNMEDAISVSMPSSGSEEHLDEALFDFMRALKGLAFSDQRQIGATDSKGRLTMEFLAETEALKKWQKKAEEHLKNRLDEAAVWALFMDKLEKARTPWGEGHLEKAITLVTKMGNSAQLEGKGLPDKVKYLAKVGKALQAISPTEGCFFLSCRWAGNILGTDHKTANKFLNALVQAGVFALVKKGDAFSYHASVYRYILKEDEDEKR